MQIQQLNQRFAPALGALIAAHSAQPVRIDGHTDAKGADDYDLELSDRRASVKDWFVNDGGIEKTSISTRGLGETQPKAANEKPDGSDDPDGRQQNRRVETTIQKGRPKGTTDRSTSVARGVQTRATAGSIHVRVDPSEYPMGVVPRAIPGLLLAPLLIAAVVPATRADVLSSESFRVVGSHFAGMGSGALVSPGPRLGETGVALGQADAVGWSGGTGGSLTTSAPGFWPIVAGALPTLDVDADALASWLDDDDDGDGLLDGVETNTGVFAGALDTGTSAVDDDSDDDGFLDGDEVAGGSDPNDPNDPGQPPEIPLAAGWLYSALAAAILWIAAGARGRRRGAP